MKISKSRGRWEEHLVPLATHTLSPWVVGMPDAVLSISRWVPAILAVFPHRSGQSLVQPSTVRPLEPSKTHMCRIGCELVILQEKTLSWRSLGQIEDYSSHRARGVRIHVKLNQAERDSGPLFRRNASGGWASEPSSSFSGDLVDIDEMATAILDASYQSAEGALRVHVGVGHVCDVLAHLAG